MILRNASRPHYHTSYTISSMAQICQISLAHGSHVIVATYACSLLWIFINNNSNNNNNKHRNCRLKRQKYTRLDICRIYRAKLKSESDAETWLRQYSEMSNSQWIVRNTFPHIEKLLYQKDYVCHHAQFAKSGMCKRKSKNVSCGASLSIKIYHERSRTC